jgi:hypothetical protein
VSKLRRGERILLEKHWTALWCFATMEPMKRCAGCKTDKPESEFYSRSAKESATRNQKLQPWCKTCMKAAKKRLRADPVKRQHEYDLRKTYRTRDLAAAHAQDRVKNLRTLFSLTLEQYDSLLEAQHGLCAICGKPETAVLNGVVKRLAVDHCHESKQVRGLLCSRCNTAIGLLCDDIDIAAKLVSYLVNPIEHPVTLLSKRSY